MTCKLISQKKRDHKKSLQQCVLVARVSPFPGTSKLGLRNSGNTASHPCTTEEILLQL